jgi:mobA/mobL protein
MNRQIKADNTLLHKLKELVNSIENTAAKIAKKLESFRNNMIAAFYEIKHNKNTADEIQRDNRTIDILLREYNKVVQEIDETGTELENLKSDKATLPQIHIFKHNALSEQIEQAETKLKNRKFVLLDDMGIKSENDVSKIKEQQNNTKTALEKISNRNDMLAEYSEKEKAQYREIKDNLSLEELSAVQEERSHICEDGIKGVIQKLRDTFGKRYDYDIFKDAETDVSKTLNEKPTSQKSILSQLNRRQQQSTPQHRKKHEIER